MKWNVGEEVEVVTKRHGGSQFGLIGTVMKNDGSNYGSGLDHIVDFGEMIRGCLRINYYSYSDLQTTEKPYDPTQVGDTDDDI